MSGLTTKNHRLEVNMTIVSTIALVNGSAHGGEQVYNLAEKVAICTTEAILIIAAVSGNVLVIYAILTDRYLKSKRSNLFLASLALADTLVALVVMLIALITDAYGRWVFGAKYCLIWVALDITCSTASILNLCVICVDRYIQITHPMQYDIYMNKRKIVLIVAIIWFISCFISIAPIERGWYEKPHDQKLPEDPSMCILDISFIYALISSTVSFYIPSFIMLLLYLKIFKLTRYHVRHIQQQVILFSQKKAIKTSILQAIKSPSLKATITLGVLVGCFFICWLPFFIINPLAAKCMTCVSPLTFNAFTWLGWANSCANPIIYSLFNSDFRKAFRRKLPHLHNGVTLTTGIPAREKEVSSVMTTDNITTFRETSVSPDWVVSHTISELISNDHHDNADLTNKAELGSMPHDNADLTNRAKLGSMPLDNADLTSKAELGSSTSLDNATLTNKAQLGSTPFDKADLTEKTELGSIHLDNADLTKKAQLNITPIDKADLTKKTELGITPLDPTKKAQSSSTAIHEADLTKKTELGSIHLDNADLTKKAQLNSTPIDKADLTKKTELGITPLDPTKKARSGSTAIDKADLTKKTKLGSTPLDPTKKARSGSTAIDKADLTKKTKLGSTPLDLTKKARSGSTAIDEADLTKKTKLGSTPLDPTKKARSGSTAIDKADLTKKTKLGSTPLDPTKKARSGSTAIDKADLTKKTELGITPLDPTKKAQSGSTAIDEADLTKKTELGSTVKDNLSVMSKDSVV